MESQMGDELRHFIFVYGTLLRGQNNYPYWLADADGAVFVARARTVRRYPFFVNLLPDYPGCSPCVLNLADCDVARCAQVEGEVFLVSDKVKAWIDVLEDVSGGTYTSLATAVELREAVSSSFQVRGGATAASFQQLSGYKAKAPIITANLYFRSKGYPSDWQASTPQSSSMLIASFSAAEILRLYGARFNGGAPAHLRQGANGDAAVALQMKLNALPASYWPPSTLAYRCDAATAMYCPAEGENGKRSKDFPPIPCHGAPLFPKPMVLFIIDGIGDNTYVELGRRTPLEVVAGVSVPVGSPPPKTSSSPSAAALQLPVTEEVLNSGENASLRETANNYATPGINVISEHGVSGLMDPYMAGKSCGSDTAHLSMFGYPPTIYYRGRGAFEALGAGLDLDDEDVAFKSNFSTFADPEENLFGDEDSELEAAALSSTPAEEQYVTHRRCDRDFTIEGPRLCSDLNGMTVSTDVHGVKFDYPHLLKVQYATEHRCGVALSGARRVISADGSPQVWGMLSDKITGTDPLKDGRPLLRCRPTVSEEHPEYNAAVYTCRLVEAASAALTQRLKRHPVNESRRRHNCALAAACSEQELQQDASAHVRKNVANLILFRGAAKKGWVPTFAVRHGLQGLILAPTCIIKGLGICCGLRSAVCDACDPTGVESLRGATGDYQSDLMVKVRAALHALRLKCPTSHHSAVADLLKSTANLTAQKVGAVVDAHYNFVVVHVKGADDAGHDKSLLHKLEMLRRSGLAMETLWNALPEGATMAVVADHSTPLEIGDHCCEPVPVSMAVKGDASSACPCDSVRQYSEVLAAGGALGRFRGVELIPLMKRLHYHYHYA